MEPVETRSKLKITAGLGDITSYEALAAAGASEVFCGYVPFSWNRKYGTILPLNRREVLFYHVQIGTLEDLRILRRKADFYGIPVTVAFNSLTYQKEQLPKIAELISSLAALGFTDHIIADVNLIRYLSMHHIPCRIHVSGEIGEWNSYTLRLLLQEFSNETTRISRIIFHRKTSFTDMQTMIRTGRSYDPELEFEAFCMNEKCHYTGGFCNSLHCDELVHLCRLEYRLAPVRPVSATATPFPFETGSGSRLLCAENCEEAGEKNKEETEGTLYDYIPGQSGCGLCAISKLAQIGITHLKIVGRGAPIETMVKDVEAVRTVLKLMESPVSAPKKQTDCSSDQISFSQETIRHNKDLFPRGCSENCYYF